MPADIGACRQREMINMGLTREDITGARWGRIPPQRTHSCDDSSIDVDVDG